MWKLLWYNDLTKSPLMLLHQKVNYTDYGEKNLREIFSMVQYIPSNMDLTRRFGVAQSDVYSHKVVELSAVEYVIF